MCISLRCFSQITAKWTPVSVELAEVQNTIVTNINEYCDLTTVMEKEYFVSMFSNQYWMA